MEDLLLTSRHCIVFTGAGISAESGVPTFRGAGGLWENYRPEDLATPQAFFNNPTLVWSWYRWRQEIVYNAKPNAAHYAVAELERMGIVKAVVTQNVDGLHQRAGSVNVIELHGSLWRARCTKCGAVYQLNSPVEVDAPVCEKCGGLLRPDVVWFGESLPAEAWRRAVELAVSSDLVLIIGTSGVVYPAALIPQIAKSNGAVLVEINIQESALTPLVDIFIKGRAGDELSKIVERVRRRLSTRRISSS
ncbi:MAG: NAD-dependent protein deacetylase [Pyrobaculum sp.]